MLFELPSDDVLYKALITRDPSYEGFAYVGVTSTGVFCRLTCTARNPKRENVVFYDSVKACMEAGFRPCLRCKPLARTGESDRVVKILIAALESEPERRWREVDLTAMGLDPSTVRRAFKRHFGMSFIEMARLRRVGRAVDGLSSNAQVIEAQLDAGFQSGSGFRAAFKRIIGDAPNDIRGCDMLKADWIETPIGPMIAVADAHALHLLEFFDRKALPTELQRIKKATGSAIGVGRLPPVDQIAAELELYFAGESASFETRLALHGSLFTKTVWDSLRNIPPGETRSYSGIAATIAKPSASRAVAGAKGANQTAIVLPCPRVIGANGALTGYGGGLWRKEWLLKHEKRMLARGGVEETQAIA
ncbi:MAG: bifunctional transcriptional activator/DNA repair enzyme AdaA [Pseudomonadales bacterium]